MIKLILISAVVMFTFFCCNRQEDVPETATSGTLRVAYDESFRSIAKQEKEVFEYLYKHARVKDTSVPQEVAHQLFLRDSVRLIFSTRMLSESEFSYLKSKNVHPKTYEFAEDGLVFVLNNFNKDTVLAIDEFKSGFISGKNGSALVVDNASGSSMYSFIQLFRLEKDTIGSVFSADSTEGVINYVAENKNAMGIISSSWISDDENPKVQLIKKKIKVARFAINKSSLAYAPYQSEISDSLYPLIRKIYIISRESKMGIANGFASFLLGEKGQRIVLKAGLLPSRMPAREVVISKKDVR